MFRLILAILWAAARCAHDVTPSAAEGSRRGLSPLPSNPKSAIRNPQWRGPATGSLAGPLSVVLALLCVLSAAMAAEAPDPSVHLFDTGARSMGLLHPRQVAVRKGWTQVPDGRLDHAFVGDAAIANDKVAVVLHRDTDLVSCYALGGEASWQTTLQPQPRAVGEFSLKTLENSPGAVAVETAWEVADGKGGALRLRLTAGEPIVEVRPGRGVERLALLWPAQQVVVPDFFGDDVAFGAGEAKARRIGLPAENVFLAMHAAGLLMCVWEARDSSADLCPLPIGDPHDPHGEIDCREGKRVWLAMLPGPRFWEGRTVEAAASPVEVLRGFRPPFPAKWRADFVGPGGVCDSITFEEPPDAAPVPETWRGQVLIYPIDRSRATPLATLLPIDVLRATLGVGPCQYVLALEGLGSGDAPATPAAVMEWVEKQFDRKRDARAADEIRERLAAMVEHVRRTDARIGQYAAFGRQVRAACEAAAGDEKAAATAAALLAVCDRLDRDLARDRAARTPEEAARLAAAVGGLVGKEGGAEACREAGEELRALGRAQDAALARARMAARRARQAARGAEDALGAKVRPMAEQILGTK